MVRRVTACLAALVLAGSAVVGCGRSQQPAEPKTGGPPAVKRPPTAGRPSPEKAGTPRGAARDPGPTQGTDALGPQASDPTAATVSVATHPLEPDPSQSRSATPSTGRPVDSAPRWIANLPRLRVDDRQVAAAGIRKLSSRRLTLYTDLSGEEIDQLPKLFDQAFPQWCTYFGVDPAKHADWKMTGVLMKEKTRFARTGLLPAGLPPFQHGYARNFDLWLYDQPSDYYRRHLLLHEGTHGFMNTTLGGCGPPWYMEGIAELLATHRWHSGRLALNHMPADRNEVPHWGRIRIIKDAFAAGRPMRLRDVIDYPVHAFLETEPYAWCWAAAALLDRHPRYRDRFRRLHDDVLEPDFNDRFDRIMGNDWGGLREEWQLFVSRLEYGHDVSATAVDFTPGKPLQPAGTRVTVAADRGWQNSGLRLEAGVAYRLRAAGRYQVADKPKIWWCEPGGVSIRYYRGRPLGILLAAVRPDRQPRGSSALLRPVGAGLETSLLPRESGTLYLKINDSAAELDDNAGQLQVEIRAAGRPARGEIGQ